MLDRGLLPHLDRERIMALYRASPGNEEASGKFENVQSSAALAANFFGFFIGRPDEFPGLPGLELDGVPQTVTPEQSLRFPWSRGRHPWLDAVIVTEGMLVGVESKRFEPFRTKRPGSFAEAYFKHDWGPDMAHYCAMRDALADGSTTFRHLDAVQLVKHAFGIVTQARKTSNTAVLYYLYAEPTRWAGTTEAPIPDADRELHRQEVARFAEAVAGDEVKFASGCYADALALMSSSPIAEVRHHAEAVAAAFAPL